ncbi:MAG: alpha/beta hydrolase [Xanthomonadaceae bacterium]|nr:alpha/beta hydrolase [Xanthomonadaceae bacterium]
MQDVHFDIPLGRITALHQPGNGLKVLALHGWLDNAASFLPLAEYLPDLNLVALDLPGHGHSLHLPTGTEYSFHAAMSAVLDVADALGWSQFCLLGHSMGAGIASLLAAACPQRIVRLVAIEMLGALTDSPEHTATRMREAMAWQRERAPRTLRVFADIERAVQARLLASRVPGSGLDVALLRLLVARGVRAVPGGVVWRSDPRLTQPSLTRMTPPQVDDLLAAITCPTLGVFATPAQPYLPDPERRRRLGLLANGEAAFLEGGHHLHMQQPAAVAGLIQAFLTR